MATAKRHVAADDAWRGRQPPRLLLDAAHCLAIKGFLPAAKTATLGSGYLVDAKSYPGDRVLYLVVYVNPQRSRGMVFSIFLTHKSTQQVFNIQNNGEFVPAKRVRPSEERVSIL
jgi:hypothetical protein